jgi:hypothetical protein
MKGKPGMQQCRGFYSTVRKAGYTGTIPKKIMECYETLVSLSRSCCWPVAWRIIPECRPPITKACGESAAGMAHSLRTRFTIKPNWSLVLGDQLKADRAKGEAAVKLLNGLHFFILLDKDGNVI